MKKIRTEKGITLVALIITIVVLLILAVVAISSITNDGILSYSTNAAKDYNQATINEQEMLGYYENYIKNYADEGSTNDEGTGGGNESQPTLQAPTISITEDTLTITAVTNAASYDVYVGGVLNTNTTSTTLDLTTLNLEAGEYQITVVAKADGYTNSVASTAVNYTVAADTVTIEAGTYVAITDFYVPFDTEGLSFIAHEISFNSNGNSYTSMYITDDGIPNEPSNLYYQSDSLNDKAVYGYDDYNGYFIKWANDNYKTIIATTTQIVSVEFGEWFNANFVKQ